MTGVGVVDNPPLTRPDTVQKRFFANFQKVEENDDGTVRVFGIASTESKDHDGEVIKASAVRAALPDWMVYGNIREMHQPIAAGTAIEASVDDDGVTHLGALIVDPATVKKIKTGVLKGFSLGGKVTKRNAKDKSIIEGLRLTEISVVDRPANPDALITLAKMDAAGRRKAFLTKTETDDESLAKSLYDVGELARLVMSLSYIQSSAVYEAASEGDGSQMPAKLKGCCQALVDCLRDMVDEETRELLGGMLDVASVRKAIESADLIKGADTRAVVQEVIESLGLKKAANLGESPMDDKTKAEQADAIQKAVKTAVDEATGPLAKSVTDLTKSVDELKTENTDLKAKLAKSESDRAAAEKLAQDIADQAVAKGYVKPVTKTEDTGAATPSAEDIAKAKKPTDVDAEMRASFKKPLSPIRGL